MPDSRAQVPVPNRLIPMAEVKLGQASIMADLI